MTSTGAIIRPPYDPEPAALPPAGDHALPSGTTPDARLSRPAREARSAWLRRTARF